MIDEAAIRQRFETLGPYLDERQRRVFATSEALAAGWGGIAAVSRITGIARSTIGRGLDEVAVGAAPDGRVRRAGAGRRPLEAADPRLIEDLERIVTPTQRGDPEQPLRWTIKSLRQIVACNGAHSLKQRLARWLLMLRDRADDDALQITQSLLAEMLEVQRPTITNAARELEGAGLIASKMIRQKVKSA